MKTVPLQLGRYLSDGSVRPRGRSEDLRMVSEEERTEENPAEWQNQGLFAGLSFLN